MDEIGEFTLVENDDVLGGVDVGGFEQSICVLDFVESGLELFHMVGL